MRRAKLKLAAIITLLLVAAAFATRTDPAASLLALAPAAIPATEAQPPPGQPARRSGLRHAIRRLAVILFASYAGLCVYVFMIQSSLIYFPSRELLNTPADIGLAFDEVMLATPDGNQIHGWFVPAPAGVRPAGTVLFCHGNAGNIGDRLDTIRIIHEMNLNLLIFDYRGYGRSGGRPGERQTYEDARAGWDYLTLKRGLPPAGIIVWGRSLGGGVATWLATEKRPAALVLESTFTSSVDLGQELYPFLPVRLLARIRYPTLKRLPALAGVPVIVVHSPDDEVIPFSHGRRLFDAAAEPRHFIEISGGHNDGFISSGKAYTDGLRTALGTVSQQEP